LDNFSALILVASAALIAAHGVVMRLRQAKREAVIAARRPSMHVSPSWLFVWSALVAACLEWWLPTSRALTPLWFWLATGVALAATAEGFMRSAGRTLQRHATTQDAARVADVLVDEGLFGATRNPIYLGMLLLFLGVAVAAGSLWALALLPGYFLALHLLVVRPEEAALRQRFGERYQRYAAAVPRYF
jgi:protein-S-isoprenylcysteine O-methyltransferase Ste14